MKPKLIDLNILDNQLKKVNFKTNTKDLNFYLFIFSFFIFLSILYFQKNYSKKKGKKQILRKLHYIKLKSNNYLGNYRKSVN